MIKYIFVRHVCLMILMAFTTLHGVTLTDIIQEHIRTTIENAGAPPQIVISDDLLYSTVVLPAFYERRGYWPAWIDENGLLPQVQTLVQTLRNASQEGLTPTDYHLTCIDNLLQKIGTVQKKSLFEHTALLADIDLVLTDAYLVYASHLLAGRVNPVTIHAEWNVKQREVDFIELLENALRQNQIRESLQALVPRHNDYARLRAALTYYRAIAKKIDAIQLPSGVTLKRDDEGKNISALRKRLILEGDLIVEGGQNDSIFNSEIETALKNFQKRYGLEATGVIDSATLEAWNIPIAHRIRQLEINLERWRWLPQEFTSHYMIVNIANFELYAIENDSIALSARVIVGRTYRRTPVFSDSISYLVLNPYWHVPRNIAVQDILPQIKKNTGYLSKNKMTLFKGSGSNAEIVDPRAVNWAAVNAQNFSFTLRQDPGEANALGRVKFMFPNKYNVYIHDTPSKELFEKSERGFSSGCIRVEKALELAGYLLKDSQQWSQNKINAAIKKGTEQTVRLKKTIPIHLLYWTAWVGRDGMVNFRKDIYERDVLLDQALREAPPDK